MLRSTIFVTLVTGALGCSAGGDGGGKGRSDDTGPGSDGDDGGGGGADGGAGGGMGSDGIDGGDTGAGEDSTLADGEWWHTLEIGSSSTVVMPYVIAWDCENAAPYHDFDWEGGGTYDRSLQQIECAAISFRFVADEGFADRGVADVAFKALALDTDTDEWVTVLTEVPAYWSWVETEPGVFDIAQIRNYTGETTAAGCCDSVWHDVVPAPDAEDQYLVVTEATSGMDVDFVVLHGGEPGR